MIKKTPRNKVRQRRHKRVRQTIVGSSERPRLCVFRSLGHIYAQVIDDSAGHTLAAASSRDQAFRELMEYGGNVQAATQVGRLVAERALEKGIRTVVFDRGGYIYHGRVKALAEAAREAGLVF